MEERADSINSDDLLPDTTTNPVAQEASPEVNASSPKNQLRSLLSDLQLTPDQTRDDVVIQSARDEDFLRDVPPHH